MKILDFKLSHRELWTQKIRSNISQIQLWVGERDYRFLEKGRVNSVTFCPPPPLLKYIHARIDKEYFTRKKPNQHTFWPNTSREKNWSSTFFLPPFNAPLHIGCPTLHTGCPTLLSKNTHRCRVHHGETLRLPYSSTTFAHSLPTVWYNLMDKYAFGYEEFQAQRWKS